MGGPSLGMQFTFGACESAGNKTLACVRPFMSLEKKPPSFAWEKGEKVFEYTKPGAIFADKRCDLSGFLWDTPKMFSSTEMFKSRGLIEAIKTGYEEAAQAMRELDFHARGLGEGMSPEEEIEALGFEIFDDNHARSLFQSISAANGPKIFHKN